MKKWIVLFLMVSLCVSCSPPPAAQSPFPSMESPAPTTPLHATPSLSPEATPLETEVIEDEWVWTPPDIHPLLLPLVIEEWPGPSEGDLFYNYGEIPPFHMDVQRNDQREFLPEDMIAGELRYDMTQEEVIGILGVPEKVYSYMEGATADNCLDLFYANGNVLRFRDNFGRRDLYRLKYASIVADLPGPRGIRIGDTMETVLQSFKIDPPDLMGNVDIPGRMSLYAEHIILLEPPNIMLSLPPSGNIESSDCYSWKDPEAAKVFVRYDYPKSPYIFEEMESGEKEYAFMTMFFLSFVIHDGEVVEYYWGCGAIAE